MHGTHMKSEGEKVAEKRNNGLPDTGEVMNMGIVRIAVRGTSVRAMIGNGMKESIVDRAIKKLIGCTDRGRSRMGTQKEWSTVAVMLAVALSGFADTTEKRVGNKNVFA